MYTLYGSPGSASTSPHAVLEEAGAKYDFVKVDLSKPRDPAYLRLNPTGRVPTLVHDGRAVTESAAISLYLADRHPKAGLAPAPDDPLRAPYLQWMVYLTNTVQEAYLAWFYPERYSTEASDAPRIKARAGQKIEEVLAGVDSALKTGPFFLGARFSTPDIYFFMVTSWQPDELKPIRSFGNILRLRQETAKRPAMRRVLEFNGMAA